MFAPPPRLPDSAPEPVVDPFLVVPLRRGLEVARLAQRFLERLFIERKAQARALWNGDVALVDDWLFHALHDVVPGGYIHRMIFEHQEILGRRGDVYAGEGRYR